MADAATPIAKGFLSKLWSAHSGIAKYVGVFGIPAMFGFLPKAAVTAAATTSGATIVTTFTTLWDMMAGTIGEFMIPGWSIIFGQLGGAAATAFNAVSAIAAPAAAIAAPSLIP